MSLGVPGSISIFRRQEPAAAPTVAGANNGVSLSGTDVVLGQDIGDLANPAVLLSDREIPLGGNDLNLNRAIDAALGIAADQGDIFVNLLFGPPGGSYRFVVRGAENDAVTNAIEFVFTKHGLYCFDDVNGTPFNFLTADNTTLYSDNGLDITPPLYRMGDLNTTLNGTAQIIDDAFQTYVFSDGLGNRFVSIDIANGVYQLGDIDSVVTNSMLEINLAAFSSALKADDLALNQGGFTAQADSAGGQVYAGLFANTATDQINVVANAFNNNFELTHNSNRYILLDWNAMTYQFGDVAGIDDGNHFTIDDANSLFIFENLANDAVIQINGVNGFTGTVSPVNSITVNGGIVTAVS